MGAELQRKDIISDEALEAPLILARNLEVAYDVVMKIQKANKESGDAGEGLTTTTEKTKKLTAEQAELKKVMTQIAAVQARNNEEYIKANKALEENRKALKEKIALGGKDAKQVDETNASMKQLQAALIKNKDAYKSLASEEARASKEGKELHRVIQAQDAQLKKLADSIGENQLSVGKYENATKNLKLELAKAKDEMIGIAATLGQDSQEFKDAAAKAGELKNELGDLNASVEAVSGSPVENLGGSFALAGQKLKALDFKGATSALKQFSGTAKGINFKSATAGAKQFGTEMLNMGMKLLKNPYVLLAIITIAIGTALYKLRDSIAFVSKAFDLMGKGLEYVIGLGKDFLDWIGLTTFAEDEKTKRIVDQVDKRIALAEEEADRKIKIAEAEGKDTLELEKAKHQKTIDLAVQAAGRLLTNKANFDNEWRTGEKEKYAELQKIIKDANAEIAALNAGHRKSEADKEEEARKKREALAEKERLKRLAAEAKENADRIKLDIFYKELEAKKLEESIVNNTQAEVDARIEASEELEKVRGEIAELELKQALAVADVSYSAQVLALQQFNAKLLEIHKQGVEDRNKITGDVTDKENKQNEQNVKDGKEFARKMYEVGKARLDKEIDLIKQKAIEGKITKTEADKQILAAEKAFADDYVNLLIKEQEQILNIIGLTPEARKEAEDKLKELRKLLFDTIFGQQEDPKNPLDPLIAGIEAAQEAFAIYSDAILNLSASLTEKKLQNIDKESEASDALLEQQLAAEDELLTRQLETQTLTDEQKAAIEEQSQARKEAYEKANEIKQIEFEKRRKQAIRKQATYEKQVALTQAIIAGALAVVKALPLIPLALLAGALAAIQIAAIASRPIPAAEKGIRGHKGGPILAGEKGSELVRMPGNRYALTDAVATVYDFPRGTDIIPHEETLKMLANDSLKLSSARGQRVDSSVRIEKKLDKINNTIKFKREWNLVGRVEGYNDGGTRARYIESLRNRPR